MNRSDLFSTTANDGQQPLAARLRPTSLEQCLGQDHILGPDKPLRRMLEQGLVHSMILWGPPGVGKTTLARLVATFCDARFESLSAVLAGVKEVRAAVDLARMEREQTGRKTILFVDEIHRFNKSQQDAFLPHVEEGLLTFIGATTENPSFELNNAFLSRLRVYTLKPLDHTSLTALLQRALTDREQGLGKLELTVAPEVMDMLVKAADGDGRRALNFLEIASDLSVDGTVSASDIQPILSSPRRFDKQGDIWYEQKSAFHKSVRGSSPDGAIYWMVRMIDGGMDPLIIVRRLVAIASEDIGNADPRALEITLNAWQAFERLGAPEGYMAIAQAAIYCACAPKSNAVYRALQQATEDVQGNPSYEVPLHLRNAPTKLLKELGHKAEYRYAHDEENAYAAGECYFPEEMEPVEYYNPCERGLEGKIKEKLQWLKDLDQASSVRRRR